MANSAKYITNVLKDWKRLPGGTWVKKTKSDKKKAAKKKKANSYKKQLKQRVDKCNARTTERIKSIPSKGEQRIIDFLASNGIEFVREYYNPKCYNFKTGNMLYFDFYIPKYNLLIEFDGIHHFKPINGHDALIDQKKRDKIKDRWCAKRDWPLLRISCFETDKIEEIICQAFDKLEPLTA